MTGSRWVIDIVSRQDFQGYPSPPKRTGFLIEHSGYDADGQAWLPLPRPETRRCDVRNSGGLRRRVDAVISLARYSRFKIQASHFPLDAVLIRQKQPPHLDATPVNPADLSVQPSSQSTPAVNPRELSPEVNAPEQVHPWLRMDPSLASAVLSKTEEELLGGLAALMRNKVETETAVRRLAQILAETGQAQKELERIRQQVRQAEDELAVRIDEQQRIREQLLESQALLRVRQEQAAEYRERWSAFQADAERVRRDLAQLHTEVQTTQPDPRAVAGLEERLSQVRAEVDSALREKAELEGELPQLRQQRDQLSAEVADLRREVEERQAALEALNGEVQRSNERQNPSVQPVPSGSDRPGQPEIQTAPAAPEKEGTLRTPFQAQEKPRDLADPELPWRERKPDRFVQGASALEDLHDRSGFESYAAQLRDAQAVATGADEKSIGLPLWLGQPLPPVAKGFDSYRLESEFFSDEPMDARVVAELVAKLPGLDGCLVVQNRGPVLASRLAEHYYEQLRVPDRDYSLLFGRLPNRRDDLRMPEGRVAIYQLENGFMTVTQMDHIVMITTSGQPRLKPGMPHKLLTIACELSKMYPAQEYEAASG